MGLFQAQQIDGGLNQVTVEYSGEVASLSVEPLTIAVLKGLLTPILEDEINFVNAPVVAKERGIEVKEVKNHDAGDFTSLIRIRVTGMNFSHQVSGTLFHKKEPRIVENNAFQVEVVPEGHLLLVNNVDRPGVIGTVGRILGNHAINIAQMQCARPQQGSDALLIIALDDALPSTTLNAISQEEGILSVRLVNLPKGF